MNDKNRYKLYFGPYHPPKVERGQRLFDEIRGTVVVSWDSKALQETHWNGLRRS